MGNVSSAGMPGAASASEQRRARLIAAFEAIDTDHSGTLEFAEVKAAFEKVGDKITDEELKKFFTVIDKNHNNSIDFEEFCKLDSSRLQNVGTRVLGLIDAAVTQPIAAVGRGLQSAGSSMKNIVVGQ